jgi:hypothetical protein
LRLGGKTLPELAVSEGAARDNTQDWLLPEAARPRSFAELESRIDVALAVARASEAAVAEIGATAIDAAEQARSAAELAERAAISAAQARGGIAAATAPAGEPQPAANPAVYPLPADEDLRLAHFLERADRVVERLRALERLP